MKPIKMLVKILTAIGIEEDTTDALRLMQSDILLDVELTIASYTAE